MSSDKSLDENMILAVINNKGGTGKGVVLVMDADEAGRKGTRDISGHFIRAGLPAPCQLSLGQGKDLNEFYQLAKMV